MSHPYSTQPNTAKWSRSISQNWTPKTVIPDGAVLLRKDDQIASLGSCFAANLVPYLKKQGFSYIESEKRTADFGMAAPENFSYDKFSAAYGNVYTARQFLQLLQRALGKFRPAEDRWHIEGKVIDPFRPGLRFPAQSDAEFDALTQYHLSRVRHVFETATVVIFTLGLTEAWLSAPDRAVFPACPGTVAGQFSATRHLFHNFSVSEIVSDLDFICTILKEIRQDIRLILTVSPVPLVATATNEHVLVASTYSKSVLRVACAEVMRLHSNVIYFPSYEIITGPQAPYDFFEADRRNASQKGVDEVMSAFLAHCEGDQAPTPSSPIEQAIPTNQSTPSKPVDLSRLVGEVECEEAAADKT